ncbi:hypothetical protein J1605_006003 [Eschrichtius robustus]|uniref:Lipase maturation factor n=1 Tax=Eschrichtius robustus TaxID=9764 RepID=A0AB34H723_ESCRO|nr:hypothetical protein J1605_006003 [Eschrichtius robustus]
MSMSRRTRPGPKMSDAQCLEPRRADEHEGFLLSSLEASGGSRVCALEAGSAHVGIPHTGSPEEGGTDVPISALARAPCALPSSPVGDSCADRPTVSIGCGLATAWWRSGLQSPTSLGSLPRALLPNTVQASFCFWNHLQTVQGARWWPQIPQHRWLSRCSEPTETPGSDGPPVGAAPVLALLPLGKLTSSLTQQNVFEVRQRGVKGKSCSPQSAAQAPLLQPETSSTFRVSQGRSVRGRLHGRSENSGWESQLLETGFLGIFLCPLWTLSPLPRGTPTSRIVLWGYRWLIFRIMLGAVPRVQSVRPLHPQVSGEVAPGYPSLEAAGNWTHGDTTVFTPNDSQSKEWRLSHLQEMVAGVGVQVTVVKPFDYALKGLIKIRGDQCWRDLTCMDFHYEVSGAAVQRCGGTVLRTVWPVHSTHLSRGHGAFWQPHSHVHTSTYTRIYMRVHTTAEAQLALWWVLWVHRVWGCRGLVSRPSQLSVEGHLHTVPVTDAGCPHPGPPQPHTVSAQLALLSMDGRVSGEDRACGWRRRAHQLGPRRPAPRLSQHTQPVPNPVAYFLHHSPWWFHRFETLSNHFLELVVPFFVFLGRQMCILHGALQILFQVSSRLSVPKENLKFPRPVHRVYGGLTYSILIALVVLPPSFCSSVSGAHVLCRPR